MIFRAGLMTGNKREAIRVVPGHEETERIWGDSWDQDELGPLVAVEVLVLQLSLGKGADVGSYCKLPVGRGSVVIIKRCRSQ
jgi:hypothetical protein